MEKKEEITKLTKEEFEMLQMIFQMGVASFMDKTIFVTTCLKYVLHKDYFEDYLSDKMQIIDNLADKFELDY